MEGDLTFTDYTAKKTARAEAVIVYDAAAKQSSQAIEKNFEKVEKLMDSMPDFGLNSLKVPSCEECDSISKERERKDWNKKGMASITGSQK